MEITDLPLFSMLKQRMTWLNQRQDLLSQNVANADTPKYISRDLKALDFDQILSGSGRAGTADHRQHQEQGTEITKNIDERHEAINDDQP